MWIRQSHYFLILSAFVVFLIATQSGLKADQYHYINELIGERAGGMGGAFTAISDDPSGAFYNPAGLAFAYDNQISLSVNTIRFQTTTYEKVLSGQDFAVDYQSFFPSYFGIVQSVGSGKMAFSIAIPNADVSEQYTFIPNVATPTANLYRHISINVDINDNTYLYGPSYAVQLSDKFTLGATVYGMSRFRKFIRNQTSTFVPTNADFTQDLIPYDIANTNNTDTYYGLIESLGLQYMPSRKFSLGFKVEIGQILFHEIETHVANKIPTADSQDAANLLFDMANKRQKMKGDTYPTNFRTGAAYFVSKDLVLSFDVAAYLPHKTKELSVSFPRDSNNNPPSDSSGNLLAGYHSETGTLNPTFIVRERESETVVNYAFGLEYYLTPNLPLRWGAFTNFANTPDFQTGVNGQKDNIDFYGTTLGVAWQTANSSIALTSAVQHGQGKGNPLGEGTPIDISSTAYSFSLTGSSRY